MKPYFVCCVVSIRIILPTVAVYKFIMQTKCRPAWQAGFLNFPGGKIEHNEWPELAAAREWSEETGDAILGSPDAWEVFATIQRVDATKIFFCRPRLTTRFAARGKDGGALTPLDESWADGLVANTKTSDEPLSIQSITSLVVDQQSLPPCSWIAVASLDHTHSSIAARTSLGVEPTII